MKIIHEHRGVLLQCDVTLATDTEEQTVNSVFVLGADYKPTGPDIAPLLDDMLRLVGEGEAEPFLNAMLAEAHA